ncbi:hypothetical protein DO97_10450 [Neosynechococcus sphagnicola sy1]|uniref:DUF2358 domain-containing protein n=1 Tax=Neosynechococcus sphagnicola sy1 TaxID=1497020 RepID=A0A098TNB1_9CYAN|nr:DUF2358 domain-containing protein [Neosynechococcus sphagnicola]KGF73815.1 hypothetical protein DO97_10450 [Neosynechococcus sphagnicola sy1]
MDILQCLREDYQRFPADQTYSLYAPDVYFQDPLNRFRGVDRYRQMIGLIQTWFTHPRLELHDIQHTDQRIETHWTLSWTAPLPWAPRIAIAGWSELLLNPDGLISSHIDYWHCTRLHVLQQHFRASIPEHN